MYSTKKKQWMVQMRQMENHDKWAQRKLERAFGTDWDYGYLLLFIRAKLETMERFQHLYIKNENSHYYGHQIRRAINMIDIIMKDGGMYDYTEDVENKPKPDSFQHYVNMKNRIRIPHPNDQGVFSFRSEAQKLRFDKAWMLLWKILSEQMLLWGEI